MLGVQISKAEMLKCVARRVEIRSSHKAYVDTLLPGHAREIFNVIGPGITENPSDANLVPALAGIDGFRLGYIKSRPGTRGALHSHDTTEVFIPMSGKWIIVWGDNEENQLELNVGDVIAIPPGVFRCFKNVSDDEAWMIGILSGVPGRIVWPETVKNEVRRIGPQVGIGLTEEGDLVHLTH